MFPRSSKIIFVVGLIISLLFITSCTNEPSSVIKFVNSNQDIEQQEQTEVEKEVTDKSEINTDKEFFNKIDETKPCSGEKEIILTGKEQKFTIDYCTHLTNSEGLKYYFSYDGTPYLTNPLKINLYRSFEGNEYFLSDVVDLYFERNDNFYLSQVNNFYAQEWIQINSFDEFKIDLTIHPGCLSKIKLSNKFDWCNTKNGIAPKGFIKMEGDYFIKYIDEKHFFTDKFKNDFLKFTKLQGDRSVQFLIDKFGFKPLVPKIVEFSYLDDIHGGYTDNYIVGGRSEYALEELDNKGWLFDFRTYKMGNTHEYVHVFFWANPVRHSWFEEGLADFMSDLATERDIVTCRNNGWAWVDDGTIPYSDFSIPSDPDAEFDTPGNRASYYNSAQCFWDYIYTEYGEDSFKEIMQVWHNARKTNPPEKKWLLKDIVNPTLGDDLSALAKKRYNYIEME
jgi:hypothetical protein